jgi:C-terminal processing protease CtpA/Prc
MIVTFEEKNSEQYEVQNEHVENIFNSIKDEITTVLEKYKNSNKDLLIALMSIEGIVKELNQRMSNEYGADKIIEFVGAIKL